MNRHTAWNITLKLSAVITITACLILLLCHSISAASHDVQELVSKRTKQDIILKYKQYKPYSLSPEQFYRDKPNYSAPHHAGQLNDNVLRDGLYATNFARYLAGLPDDVTLDYSLAEQQQAGAVLMSELGIITHHPVMPAGMAEDFFLLGAEAARSSNLSAGRDSLYNTIIYGYMADHSSTNLESVGHRRWILNPLMKKTMFGLAYNPNSYFTTYSTMYAFNNERSIDEVSYQYIAWPSAGLFPTEVLTPEDPWSITLNSEHYDVTRLHEAYVTMHRERDMKQWTFDGTKRDKTGDYFNINLHSYGVANAIIFRPSEVEAYAADDHYHVTLHNIYTIDGQRTSISYSTQLFDLQAAFLHDAHRFALVGQKLKFPFTGQLMQVTSSDPSIASIDHNGIVTAHKPGIITITIDNDLPKQKSSIQLTVMSQAFAPIQNWAKTSIAKANEAGILYFNPYSIDLSTSVTREAFVHYVVALLQALHVTIEESSYYGKMSPFSDVSNIDHAILWAYENRIIKGTGYGKFSPDDTITREQAATLLLNVYNYLKGREHPIAVKPFTDEDLISGWAKSSVKRAAELSIMGPTSGNRFDPKGKYSHEQTIVTMLRLYQKFAMSM